MNISCHIVNRMCDFSIMAASECDRRLDFYVISTIILCSVNFCIHSLNPTDSSESLRLI